MDQNVFISFEEYGRIRMQYVIVGIISYIEYVEVRRDSVTFFTRRYYRKHRRPLDPSWG